MSCLHIAASGLTSSFCVLLVVLLFAGCNESDSIARAYESKYPSRRPGRSLRSLDCLEWSKKNIKIGSRVTLITDRQAFQNSFNNVPYIWDDAMTSLLGQTVTVVDRPQPGIFGLPKSDPSSSQPVWWYPFSVILCVEDNGATIATTNQPTATTNAADKCLDVFFAIENYRSCCTNFGHTKKGREPVCRMASPCAKGGMQDPRCQFASRTKAPTKAPPETTVVAARFAPRSNAELKAAIAQCLKLSSDCSKGPRGPIWSWDVSGVTDMRYLFVDKHYNAVPGADKFNGDISNWDVSSVTRMGGMFYKAQSFNGDLSKWDVSKVTDMEAMFEDAASFNSDISKWDVSKANDVKSMFHGAKSFSQKLCGSWANLSAGRKRNMFDKSDLSLFCKTTSKTTDAADKCLDVFFAIENYRSCCTNFGYTKKGREPVCRMASPCAKGGMQDPRCQFATRTTASAPTTTKYRTRLGRTPPRDKVPDKYRDYNYYGSGYRYRSTPGPARDYRSSWEQHKYESSKHSSTPGSALDYYYYYWAQHKYESSKHSSTPEPRDYYYSWAQHKYESSKHACSVLAGFEVPAIALMICLAITTAVSAHLLRKIEQAQPDIELLPADKMVAVQACEDAVPALIKANVIDDTQVSNGVNSTPDLKV